MHQTHRISDSESLVFLICFFLNCSVKLSVYNLLKIASVKSFRDIVYQIKLTSIRDVKRFVRETFYSYSFGNLIDSAKLSLMSFFYY